MCMRHYTRHLLCGNLKGDGWLVGLFGRKVLPVNSDFALWGKGRKPEKTPNTKPCRQVSHTDQSVLRQDLIPKLLTSVVTSKF